VLERDGRIAYALVFGSAGVAGACPQRSRDVAIASYRRVADHRRSRHAPGGSGAGSSASGHLVLLHEAPPGLAYRIFRDGVTLFERDHRRTAERKAQAVLDYLDSVPPRTSFEAPSRRLAPWSISRLWRRRSRPSEDAVLSACRACWPPSVDAFLADRTAREVVTLNLFWRFGVHRAGRPLVV